jgi:hypothetical protein
MAADSGKQTEITMNPLKTYLTAVSLIFSLVLSANIIGAEELSIYYSNDMHGKVEPCG